MARRTDNEHHFAYLEQSDDRDYLGAEVHKLIELDSDSPLSLESGSVYGSAIAMPQVARSSKYNTLYTILAVRSYFSLFLNLFIQLMLLLYIGEATQVMAPLGGQMHLCDFGAGLEECPGGEHCTGPGGTEYTSTRLYGYTQWAVQKFTKQALLDVLPEQHDTIENMVDPGEYGIENYKCRLLCIFAFVMSVVSELYGCWNLGCLLWMLPSEPAKSQWVYHLQPESNATQTRYQIAGMPRHWKVLTCLFVLLPKLALCHYVLREGTKLLMDTAGIMDMVLGAMSMGFVLSIDEVIFETIASVQTKHIMAALVETDFSQDEIWVQDSEGPAGIPREIETDISYTQNVAEVAKPLALWRLLLIMFPRRLAIVIAVVCVYVSKYYIEKCVFKHGQWVSKDMYLPLTTEYSVFDFVFDCFLHTLPRSLQPFWTMPDAAVTAD
jgi:hypothetical protein